MTKRHPLASLAWGLLLLSALAVGLFSLRYALPGIGNNWQVILKATALVSLLGLEDVVKATQLAGKSTWEPFYFAIVCGLIYLLFTTVSNGVLLLLERRYTVGVKRADL